MSVMHSLGEFAAHLLTIEADMKVAEVLEKACQMTEKAAKRAIGTYEFGWEQLAEDTQRERERLGYSANEPLLRKGTLRDSISHYVEGNAGYVGSTSKIALYMELGIRHIPPRNFLAEAAMQNEHKIHEMAFAIVSGVMAHGGPNYHLFKLILHVLQKAYHEVKKLGRSLLMIRMNNKDDNK